MNFINKMFDKIIDFFKGLFSSDSNEENVTASEWTDADAISVNSTTTRAEEGVEEQSYSAKVLVSNCIKGYSLVDFSASSNEVTINYDKIPFGESRVMIFQSKEQPAICDLKCNLLCESDGEVLENFSASVLIPNLNFTTINVTDILLGIKPITFDAVVDEPKEDAIF